MLLCVKFYYNNSRKKGEDEISTKKITDLKGIRSVSKTLLFAVDINCDNPFGMISHPFTNHIFSVGENHEMLNLANEEYAECLLAMAKSCLTKLN